MRRALRPPSRAMSQKAELIGLLNSICFQPFISSCALPILWAHSNAKTQNCKIIRRCSSARFAAWTRFQGAAPCSVKKINKRKGYTNMSNVENCNDDVSEVFGTGAICIADADSESVTYGDAFNFHLYSALPGGDELSAEAGGVIVICPSCTTRAMALSAIRRIARAIETMPEKAFNLDRW